MEGIGGKYLRNCNLPFQMLDVISKNCRIGTGLRLLMYVQCTWTLHITYCIILHQLVIVDKSLFISETSDSFIKLFEILDTRQSSELI